MWSVLDDELARPEPYTLFEETPHRIYENHELDIIALAWCESSPNLFLSSAFDQSVILWNVLSESPALIFNSSAVVSSLCWFSDTDTHFFAGTLDKQILIW